MKKKTSRTREPEELEIVEETPIEELDPFDRARIEFAGVETRIKVTILRYEDGTQKYLKRVDYYPDKIDPEWIRKKWGAGSYLLRFHDADNPRRGWSQVLEIAADESEHRSAAPSSSGIDMTQILFEQNKIMLQGLLSANRSAPAGGGGGSDPALLELVKGLQAQNNVMLQSALNRGGGDGGADTFLGIFEKSLQIAADAKTDSEGGWLNQIGRIARDLLPALAEFQKMRPPAPAGSPARAPMMPAPLLESNNPATPASSSDEPPITRPGAAPRNGAPKPAPASSGGEQEEDNMMEEALRQFAPEIVKAIEGGARPQDVADGILDSVPPMFYSEFEKLKPEDIIRFSPTLQPHRGFVSQLVEQLKNATNDTETDQYDQGDKTTEG